MVNSTEAEVAISVKEPAPVNPIPDRKHELLGDQTIDIEEYLMTEQQRDLNELDTAEETFEQIEAEETADDIDEQNSDLERRERLEGAEETEEENSNE